MPDQETVKKWRCCAALKERTDLYGTLSSSLSSRALAFYNSQADRAIHALQIAEDRALAELAAEQDETAGRGFAPETFDGHTVAEWREHFLASADSFIRWAADLPAEDQAQALRLGRDALNRCAVELSGAKARPEVAAKPDGGAPIGG